MLKKIERWFRRLTLRFIAGLMGQSARGERPDWRQRPYRVLFLRHDRIGDMILSTGVLRAIAGSHPTVMLDVLASPGNAPVLRHEPYVNEVVVFDKKRVMSYPRAFAGLRSRHYDAVIDCMVTAPSLTTLLLMLATGAKYRIGVQQLGNDFAYTLPVPARESAEHLVDRLGALVTAFGLQPSALDLRPRVHLSRDERVRGERVWTGETDHAPRRPRLLVNVSAGRSHHAWPDERFADLMRRVNQQVPGADIVVLASPADRERAMAIAERGGGRYVRDGGIRDAMAIVAAADLVFTPDTSIGHACNAFDTGAVIMHPLGNATIWGPYQSEGRVVESSTGLVADIPVDEAARPVIRLLGSGARPD
jgi:ADP-heptose:LPS heptosyltransferase